MKITVSACGAVTVFVAIGCSGTTPEQGGQSSAEAVEVERLTTVHTLVDLASCMDARGAATTDGTRIEEWSCNGSSAQVFEVRGRRSRTLYAHESERGQVRRRSGFRYRERHEGPAVGLQWNGGAKLPAARRRVGQHHIRQLD